MGRVTDFQVTDSQRTGTQSTDLLLTRRGLWRWLAASGLVLAIPSSSVAAASRWPDERTAGPFVFHADFSLDDIGNFVLDLADLQTTLASDLNVREASEPIHVFLFQRKATYQSYLKHFFPTVSARRAMYIKQRGPGMVFAYRHPDLAIDVRHESTHALLHAVLPRVPLWLDEGLAEYYEVEPGDRLTHQPYLTTVRKQIDEGVDFQLETLERLPDLNSMGVEEYRHAWAWVHFLLHGPLPAKDSLRSFLIDAVGKAGSIPLSQRLRLAMPEYPQRFLDHFRADA